MGFGSAAILKSRVNDYATFIDTIGSEKIEEIDRQTSDLIFQKTSVPVPNDPADAPGMLSDIWTDIVMFKIIQWQTDLSDEEKERRKLLYESAMNLLSEIQSGKLILKNTDGTAVVTASSPFQFTGTKRLGTTP